MNSPRDSRNEYKINLNDVERVFGTPTSPSNKPDNHLILNERRHTDDITGNGMKPKEEVDSARPMSPSQPLLEPDKDRPLPPLAGPEIDDLGDTRTHTPEPFPGIDDGLLENDNNNNPNDTNKDGNPEGSSNDSHPMLDEGVGTEDGKWPWTSDDQPDFPYDMNGFEPRFGVDDRPMSPTIPGSIPDVNTYQQKKNLAQGMMDLALLSANANQLRYVLESSSSHPYYYPSLIFIFLSIAFQIAVGVGLIMNSRYNVKDDKEGGGLCKADRINNLTVLGVFLITIVNVFITSFSINSTVVQAAQ